MKKSRQAALVPGLFLIILAALALSAAAKDKWTWGDYSWGVYGGNKEASRLGREELMARENYCPTSGCVVRLESVSVKPPLARKGARLVLATSYTILTPEQIAIPVTITREIVFKGKSLGKTKTMETRKLNGTWDQETNFFLPGDAAPGEYTLITQVSTGYGMDTKSIQFRVEG